MKMPLHRLYIIFMICAANCFIYSLGGGLQCDDISNGNHGFSVWVNSAKDHSGEWETTFTVRLNTSNDQRNVDFNVTKDYITCQGNNIISIQGVLRGNEASGRKSLKFHPRHGKNVKLINDRKTALRINVEEDHGVVYTERTLKRGEMFTVRMEKVYPRRSYNLGIGLTSRTPYDENVPDQYIHTQKNMWLYYHCHFYINGTRVSDHYGVPMDDDNYFKVGDTVGLMITDSGELHFYINGADQGPAANDIPKDVYGVVELRYKTVQVSIVD